jgi:threonine/homoserine/homoserine lactone efflux protein
MSALIEGIILGLSVAAPIGPTNIELIRRGLKSGFWSCIAFGIGVDVALILYLAVIFAGLSYLTEATWFNLGMSVFGVVVLFYLGYTSLRDFFRPHDLELDSASQDRRHFIPGVILTISNPAVLLFWSGIIGVNLGAREFSLGDGLFISGGILVGVSLWILALSALVHGGRRFITPRVFAYISGLAGLVLIAFGLAFGWRLWVRYF